MGAGSHNMTAVVGDTEVVRRARHSPGLTGEERGTLLKPLLPPSQNELPTEEQHVKWKRPRLRPIRIFLRNQLYLLVHTIIHIVFSLYVRLRIAYHGTADHILSVVYYHHRTPELVRRDIRRLDRLPEHLSVILTLRNDGRRRAGTALERLMDEAAEIAAWCSCAGIPALSIYEKTGVLKEFMPALHNIMHAKLRAYWGRRCPGLQLRAPHVHANGNGETFSGREPTSGSEGMRSLNSVVALGDPPDLTHSRRLDPRQPIHPTDLV